MRSRRGRSTLRRYASCTQEGETAPALGDTDRAFWVGLRKPWPGWASRLLIVHADTVARWNRGRFRRYWAKISQPHHPGRPRVDAEIRQLIRTMAQDGWAAPRIQTELTKLGFLVSEMTVSRAVHPTAAWVLQQLRDTFPYDTAPKYLILDRNAIFSAAEVELIKPIGAKPHRISYRSPWQFLRRKGLTPKSSATIRLSDEQPIPAPTSSWGTGSVPRHRAQFQGRIMSGDQNPLWDPKAWLGYAYALAGRREEALGILDELEKHAGRWLWVAASIVAVLAVLGALNLGGLRDWLTGGPGPPRIDSIAVLPLENLG